MTGRSKRFLDPAQLHAAVAEVGAIAAREGVRVALIGGLALQYFGSDRLTGDVDFAAEAMLEGLPRGTPLSFGGVQTTAPSGVPAALIVRDDDYEELYNEAIAGAVHVQELPVPLVRPEYLAAMKMAAARDRDTLDLEFLLRAGVVDVSRARQIIYRHLGPYAARELDRIVDEVEWKRSRERAE
ncbi:MAG: hypothetical protein HYV63_30585 [Candidatus Schekmanbacteria bacterium]|nr:hypothetical protein [Candidatus Schekmanbacteria bacterium]